MKIIFLGVQGSGKSTQAKILAKKLSMPYLEMGHLLRLKADQPDNEAKKLKAILDSGQLVENNLTISILREKLNQLDPVVGYILDGFPRNAAQYNALDPDIELVFYVNVSDEEATKRLFERARSDDTSDALKKRLDIYHGQTEPLLANFAQKNILQEVDGQRPVGVIHQEIVQIVKSHNKYQ